MEGGTAGRCQSPYPVLEATRPDRNLCRPVAPLTGAMRALQHLGTLSQG